jgi:hypothetical protein
MLFTGGFLVIFGFLKFYCIKQKIRLYLVSCLSEGVLMGHLLSTALRYSEYYQSVGRI